MQNKPLLLGLLAALPVLLAAARDVEPDPLEPGREIVSLLPDTCQLLVEGPGLAALLERGLEDPFLARVLGSTFVETLLAGAEVTPASLLARGEELLGRPPLPALASMTRRGAALGVSLGAGGPKSVLVLHGDDARVTAAVLTAAFEALERKLNLPGALAAPQRRRAGADLWSLGDDLRIARRDSLLVLANDEGLLRDVLELAAHAGSEGLSGQQPFRAARDAFRAARDDGGAPSLLRGWANLAAVEALPGARPKLAKLRAFERQPAVQALLGPGVATLGRAARLSGSLALGEDALALHLAVETGAAEGESVAALALRPGGRPTLGPPPDLSSPDDVAHAVLYRDYATLFQRRAELFPATALPGFAKAVSDLAVFFGGGDLGEDVLPGYSPWLEVVARPVTFDVGRAPEIPLPAVALVTRLADEATGEELVAAFQSLLGIMNVDRAQNEKPALRMRLAIEGDVQLTTARFPAPGPGDGVDLRYNLQPALAIVAGCAVLGTHERLVRELVRELASTTAEVGARSSAAAVEHLRVDGRAVARALADNMEALVMQKVLDDGVTRAEAQAELGGLRLLLAEIASAAAEVRYPDDRHAELRLVLTLAGPEEARAAGQGR